MSIIILNTVFAAPSTKLEPRQLLRTTQQRLVMTLPKDSHLKNDPIFSPDGTRAVAIYSLGHEHVLMVNGKEIGTYEKVRDIAFDRQNMLSFAAFRNGLWHVVSDDYEGKGYESLSLLGVFAGNIWWMAKSDNSNKYKLIRNRDQVGGPILKAVGAICSSDREHLAVTGFKDDKAVIIVDGVEQVLGNSDYFDVNQPYFDKDGKLHFVKTNRNNGRNVVEFNGKTHSPYQWVGTLAVSPDGKHIAYSASNDKRMHQGGSFFRFKTIEYFERLFNFEEGSMVVRNGKEGKRYQSISSRPLFSPDSTKLAYAVQNNKFGQRVFNREKGESFSVVLNDQIDRNYAFVRNLTFSPDSSKLAYIAGNNKAGRFIIINGQEGNTYEDITDFTFSPDSKHYAYRARADARWFVVVDGKEGESFHWVGVPVFSDDSRHLRYGAQGGITLLRDEHGRILAYPTLSESGESYSEFLVNERGLTYSGHKNDERLWTTTNAWIYTSRNEDELYWVDETVGPLPSGGVKKTDKPRSDHRVKFVDKALGAKPLPFSLSYAHPNVVTGKNDRVVIPALFTFVRNERGAKNGVPVSRDEEEYSMVLQKFDLKEIPFSSNEMDLE